MSVARVGAFWLGLALCTEGLALELSPDDFRITEAGPALDEGYVAVNPGITYNATANEFLLVWSGDSPVDAPVLEDEIYAQRIDGTTGRNIGSPVRVSRMGPDVPNLSAGKRARDDQAKGLGFFEALNPEVAWNSQNNTYLVVWWGDDNTGTLVDDKREVFGRRLAADASPLDEQFRISFMGLEGDTEAEGKTPAVAYSASQNEFFVAWSGDNIVDVTMDQETEIWGQRIAGDSNLLLERVIRISDMGAVDGNPSFTAADCAIAVDEVNGNYFVTWEGDDDSATGVNGDVEVYGQLIDMATGDEVGPNDIRISALGPPGDTRFDSTNASPAYNPLANEYLVAWNGSDDNGGSVRNDMEIWVKRIGADGSLLEASRRITSMGPDGSDTYWALNPILRVDPVDGTYLLVFRGEDDAGMLVNNEFEVYGHRLNPDGTRDRERERLSQMGPDGNSQYGAGRGDMAYNSQTRQFLTVWDGNDDREDLAFREIEVFGQFLLPGLLFSDSFELQ
ncbi:MAG: hypothetical protein AAF736_14550 [Pseudomonadota bacterium]